MKALYTTTLVSLFLAVDLPGQYCSPSFFNGCVSWSNLSVDIGSIHWTVDDCSASDMTSMIADVVPGTPMPLQVVNANWCGCGVWIDLDNDEVFSPAELFHGSYGEMETATYNLQLTIPIGTSPGAHRMRIVAGWGTDCVTQGGNGDGPCGDYQYGSFNDFTLNVTGASSVGELAGMPVVLGSANPTDGPVRLLTSQGLDHVRVIAVDGRSVLELPVAAHGQVVDLDLGALPDGAYLLACRAAGRVGMLRVIKQ